MRKNNRGFTLVELLVVMVILGIVGGLSLPAIKILQEKGRDRKFTTYQESLAAGAKLYVDSYSDDIFGRKENGCACVRLSELETKKLAKDISINNITCNTDNSFVRITKIDDIYTYASFLGCKDKNQEDIDFIFPKADDLHTFESEGCNTLCNENVSNGMYINATPKKSTNYTRKKNIKVIIQSISGINQGIEMFYSWSTSKTGSETLDDYKRVKINAPQNQKETIASGQLVKAQSSNISTPSNKSGKYYLHIRVDRLYDLYDEAWYQDDGGKYIVFGPYNIDNEPPVINNLSVISNNSDYYSINPTLEMDAEDNFTPKDKIKFCLSVAAKKESKIYNYYLFHKNGGVERELSSSTNECDPSLVEDNRKKYYDLITDNMALPAITKYQNKAVNYPLYINVVDEAGNSARMDENYNTSPQYTLTYDLKSGESRCNSQNKKVIVNKTGDTTWGKLCQPNKDKYVFAGWYTSDGTKITSESKVEKDLTVTARWEIKGIKFQFKLMSDETLVTPTKNGDSTYNWSTNSDGLILLNGKVKVQTADYDTTILNLPNYNNSTYLKITKSGYIGKPGEEWLCESGCKNENQTFSHDDITNFNASDICSSVDDNCVITLRVNWMVNNVKFQFKLMPGETLVTPTKNGDSTYNWSTDNNGMILLDGKLKEHSVSYDSTSLNLPNYNNSSYIKITKSGYIGESAKEWACVSGCKKADQTFSHDDITNFKASDICSDTKGNCVITLRVNWRPTKLNFQFKLMKSEGETILTPTSGSSHNWSTNSNGLILLNGNVKVHSVDSDATILNLPNYNNSTYLKISKEGYIGQSGKEWVCVSGCKTSGQKFSQEDITNFNANSICDVSNKDCTVTLKVNWTYGKPATPTLTYDGAYNLVNDREANKVTYNGDWTNKDLVKINIKTSSPKEIIGKWYYKFGSNGSYALLKDRKGATKGEGLNDFGFSEWKESKSNSTEDCTLYIIVCNKNATGANDTNNCSAAKSIKVKIDRTKPRYESTFDCSIRWYNEGKIPIINGWECSTAAVYVRYIDDLSGIKYVVRAGGDINNKFGHYAGHGSANYPKDQTHPYRAFERGEDLPGVGGRWMDFQVEELVDKAGNVSKYNKVRLSLPAGKTCGFLCKQTNKVNCVSPCA